MINCELIFTTIIEIMKKFKLQQHFLNLPLMYSLILLSKMTTYSGVLPPPLRSFSFWALTVTRRLIKSESKHN